MNNEPKIDKEKVEITLETAGKRLSFSIKGIKDPGNDEHMYFEFQYNYGNMVTFYHYLE